MAQLLSKKNNLLFEQWGKQGGLTRARNLSAQNRTTIASLAAKARWGKKSDIASPPSIRLSDPAWDDPVYIEEILSEGQLSAWQELYHKIADQPFSGTALALKKVLAHVPLYGVIPLWQGILKGLQGSFHE